jgi:hypothetical protein
LEIRISGLPGDLRASSLTPLSILTTSIVPMSLTLEFDSRHVREEFAQNEIPSPMKVRHDWNDPKQLLWLGVRFRALLHRSELAMNARTVNVTILFLLVFELGSGLGSFLIGVPDDQ